jgi:hypothetical protein
VKEHTHSAPVALAPAPHAINSAEPEVETTRRPFIATADERLPAAARLATTERPATPERLLPTSEHMPATERLHTAHESAERYSMDDLFQEDVWGGGGGIACVL